MSVPDDTATPTPDDTTAETPDAFPDPVTATAPEADPAPDEDQDATRQPADQGTILPVPGNRASTGFA
ncbi:MAG: hypothetical protein IR158_11900 [Cellulomonas sp.]|jgi:hypothetical protein|uniref:hypothetical protein n=1 Tax=Cellulomonas sp. TaxID=40001 RepID=UPI0019EF2DE0|nr:hypothetical protein [Cellulomonas sp.]MBF0688451.1 hypothetical protein [Cellulomonas sp.]